MVSRFRVLATVIEQGARQSLLGNTNWHENVSFLNLNNKTSNRNRSRATYGKKVVYNGNFVVQGRRSRSKTVYRNRYVSKRDYFSLSLYSIQFSKLERDESRCACVTQRPTDLERSKRTTSSSSCSARPFKGIIWIIHFLTFPALGNLILVKKCLEFLSKSI